MRLTREDILYWQWRIKSNLSVALWIGLVALIIVLLIGLSNWNMAGATDKPHASAREQALTQQLIKEINANLDCNTQAIALQEQLKALRASLKEKGAAKKQDRLPLPKKKP